jgi:hypothetical protein
MKVSRLLSATAGLAVVLLTAYLITKPPVNAVASDHRSGSGPAVASPDTGRGTFFARPIPAGTPDRSQYTGTPDPRQPQFRLGENGLPTYFLVPGGTPGAVQKVVAGDAYKITFSNAAAQQFLCHGARGFDVITIWVSMYFPNSTTRPTTCSVTLSADMELADVSTPGCPKPGLEVCPKSTTTFNVAVPPGGTTVSLGVDMACNCADFADTYAYGIFVNAVTCPEVPSLVLSGNAPSLCKDYYSADGGVTWTDMFAADPTLPGNLLIWGVGVCCDNPVPGNDSSWGALKQRYDQH